MILRGVFLCRRADVDYFFQGNAANFALDPLGMRVPGTYLDFPAAWQQFVTGDVVRGLAKIFAVQPQNEAERERVLKAASACVAWESSASRLKRDESSQSQPNQKYALMASRILIHYMINGGFLGADGDPNRDNNYILDHVDRLKEIPVHIVHGRYDLCHLHQAEALVRALRAVGNNEVNYFITMARHGSLEPETDSKLCAIMNDLPLMSPFDRGGK
jgi:proline iminopeptidase